MDLAKECELVRQAAGLNQVTTSGGDGEGYLELEGKDALHFLHRMLANDVRPLGVGDGRRSLLLDLKGHVTADLSVLRTGEEAVALIVARGGRQEAFTTLAKYGIADAFEIFDRTDEHVIFTVQGPRALEAVASLVADPIALAKELSHTRTKVAGHEARIVRHDRSGLGGLDVIVPMTVPSDAFASLHEALLQAVAKVGGGLISATTLHTLWLESGRPRFGADFGSETIPQEARLEEASADAMSFDKGCFFGQEVVARLRFRGHVNKLLVGLVLDGLEPPGTALKKDGKDVGKITSIADSPRLGKTIALGYVRRELASDGTVLDAAMGRATVVPRPFV
jgi:folate-binding protein YgfZ